MDKIFDEQVLYYIAVWSIGTAVGCCRCLRDGGFNSVIHLCSIGCVSGSIAFGFVALGDFYARDWGVIGCGLAALVASLGREVTDALLVDFAGAFRRYVRKKIFGVDTEPEKNEENKEHDK
jgi:hypothetical protein